MRYIDLLEAQTDYDLQARFDHFNELLFGGKLPKVPLRFGRLKNAGGVCKYSVHTPREYANSPKRVQQQHAMLVHHSVNIVISDLYKRSNEALDGILVHEMIHAHLIFIENDLFDQHGAPFRRWIKKCSDILGWQVPLTDKIDGLELADGVKDKTYVVLVRQSSKHLVYAILSPPALTPMLRDDIIAKAERYQNEGVTAYEIATSLWTKKALRNRAQRPKSAYKITYFHLTDMSLLDDLADKGKVLFATGNMPVHEGALDDEMAAIRALNAPLDSVAAKAKEVTNDHAFRAWFGDSNVFDGIGDPMPVHHFTWFDFNQFDRMAILKRFKQRDPDGIDRVGFWFSGNPKAPYGPRRMDCYLRLEKPLWMDDVPGGEDCFRQLDRMIKHAGGATKFREEMMRKGHDGIIMAQTKLDGYFQDVFIVFEPNQIKSVNNRGKWDRNSNDIMESEWIMFRDPQRSLITDGESNIMEASLPHHMIETIFYHGTGTDDAAKAILRKGLQPPILNGKKNYLTPVDGHVYLTPDLSYAIIYAIGGDYSSYYDNPKFQVNYRGKNKELFDDHLLTSRGKASRYGYVFTVTANALGVLQPDEDEVGEFYGWILDGGPSKFHNAADHKRWAKAQESRYAIHNFKSFMDHITTENQKHKIRSGEITYFAHVGKKAVARMDERMKTWLIELGMHVAHHGPVMPAECWRFDKTKIGWLKKDVSNFFELAQRIR